MLATLAITQPLLSTLGENPTFFIAHSVSPGKMVAFTAIVSLAPAAVLGTLMLAGHAISAEAGERVFYASMAVLAFVFVLQVVDAIPGPAVAVVAVAAVVGYGLMILYSARGPVRSTVSLLAVFPVAVVALFLFHSPASSIVFPADVEAVALDDLLGADFAAEHLAADGPTPASSAPSNPGPASSASASSAPASSASASSAPATSTRAAASNTAPASSEPTSPAPDSDAAVRPASMVERLNDRFPPIYVLVLDELPWASLLDMSGRIDAVRYPNFARLGATSHVFTNATTVAFTTEEAVPALLSGTLQAQPAPVFSLYPNNLFTLLGGVYDVSSSDPLVDLCPPAVCNGSPPEQILELIAADEATRSTQPAASSAAPTTTASRPTTTAAPTTTASGPTTTAASATTTASEPTTTAASAPRPPPPTTTAASATATATTTATGDSDGAATPTATATATASATATTTAAAGAASTAAAGASTTLPVPAPADGGARSDRGGSLSLLLKDAAIVFGHLASPEGVDLGLPSIGATWGSFGRTPTVPAVAVDAPEPDPATATEPSAATTTIATTAATAPSTTAPSTTDTTTTATSTTAAATSAADTTHADADPVTALPTGAAVADPTSSAPVDPQRVAEERMVFLDSLITSDSRVADFRAEVAAMEASELPRLHYLHSLLPHVPWRFRPDGSTYADIDLPGYFSQWDENPGKARFGQQRHLLQLGLVDRLLGEYLDRLEAIGDFDRATVIVTADHGISFVPGERSRGIGEANAGGIANVPLLYKEPGQRAGTVQTRPVQLIDVVPTIAGRLELDPPWTFDGHDMLAAGPDPDRRVRGPYGIVDLPGDLGAIVEAVAAGMHQVFGDGASGSLYGLGGAHDLIGTQALDWATDPSQHCWILERPATVPDADGAVGYAYGRIDAPAGAGIAMALSIDGVVAGTARSYLEDSVHRVYAIGDPQFWRADQPTVELHEIVGRRLALIERC